MAAEVLAEEYEVLSSIFPEELTKLADDELEIRVEPEEQPPEEDDQIILTLKVHYPPEYPDVIPDLSLDVTQGELSDTEKESLLDGMKTTGEESLGMAMVFSLVSQLQESIRLLVEERIASRAKAIADAARKEVEKEEARTKGTTVTVESFNEWRRRFEKERQRKIQLEDEEKMKTLSPKEREEYRKNKTKLTGRQIFERGHTYDDEDATAEEGVVSVDISQYDRRAAREEDDEDEANRVHFSDSD